MSKKTAAKPSSPALPVSDIRRQLEGKHVCPFCGVMRADATQPCPRCTLDDTAATRSATRQRIGPWFVLQARNPSAPGMKLSTLQSLVRKGHVTPKSVVRGPTTEQMWTFAAGVRGLSREFGLCFNCGESVATDASKCTRCGKSQELPADPDTLLESVPMPATPTFPAPTPVPSAPVLPTPGVGPAIATPTPQPLPSPLPPPPPMPVPPLDLLADRPSVLADTGMNGGTSLDLQADTMFPIAPARAQTTPRPAPAGPRPTVVQRAPQPLKDDAILSASELAAAFQLDFKPPGSRSGNTERRPVRTLAGLILIGVIAAGVVFTFRQDWRDSSLAWLNERWGTVAATLEKPAKPAGNPPAPAKPGAPAPVTPVTPANREPPRPAVVAPTPGNPTPANPTPVTPTAPAVQPPATVALPTPAQSPAPTPTEAKPTPVPTPTPTPVVVAPSPTPARADPVPEPADENLSIDQAITRASDLRLKAIDAQTRQDWAEALHLYEQIQKLPRDAWPADLTLRLDVARRHVGKN